MSKSLNELLERLRKDGDPKVKEWHGRLNYTSPRMAESWNVPERPLTFESGIAADATRRVMAQYRNEILEERGLKTAEEIFAERTKSAPIAGVRAKGTSGRLTPFEAAFRVDPEAQARASRRKRGLLRRLFGRH